MENPLVKIQLCMELKDIILRKTATGQNVDYYINEWAQRQDCSFTELVTIYNMTIEALKELENAHNVGYRDTRQI